MKLVSCNLGSQAVWGVWHDGQISIAPAKLANDLSDAIDRWDVVFPTLTSALDSGSLEQVSADKVELLPPLARPEKLICIGKNYADHALETGSQPPPSPIVFNKFASSIIGPDDVVQLPKISQRVDYEAELVVVIGTAGRDIPLDSALKHVFGYSCGNDISARDWQKSCPGKQWLLGKTFDTFAPLGPCVVTHDEVADPQSLDIQLRLNGEVMQKSNTRNMIFPVAELISHISQFVTLRPGDLIFTGTPDGVGMARNPPVFLQPEDQLEVEIERVGVLRNRVGGPSSSE